jgi:hypothetical protein
MYKRKLATLVAASFAGLMLSSPSFATDANKAQTTSGGSTSAQTTASSSGAPESRSIERAEQNAATSEKAEADAKAEYNAAVEKCNTLPIDQRNTCIQDAEAAQTLALEKNREGTQASGAPESRSGERDDKKAAESDASSNTAMKNQTEGNTPSQTGAPESRVPGPQSAK